MPMPRKLTDDQVEEIRHRYQRERRQADAVENGEPVYETENALADEYGVSRSLIRKIVLGLSYADVPGPLDEQRRATAREVLEATPPTAVQVTITRPGQDRRSFVYPPGTEIAVQALPLNPDDYDGNGRLIAPGKTSTTRPTASSTPASPTPRSGGRLTYRQQQEATLAELKRKMNSPDTQPHMRGSYRTQYENLYVSMYGDGGADQAASSGYADFQE